MKTKIAAIICAVFVIFGISLAITSCNSADVNGIANAEINEKGELILIYSDGKEQNLGIVVGKDGIDGKTGTSISV